MKNIPENLHYTKTHEWLEKGANGAWKIGITDYAQAQLGDIVFVELPALGAEIDAGGELFVIESVKAAETIIAPAKLSVTQINETLTDNPEQINTDPYGAGFALEFTTEDTPDLLDAAAYQNLVADE